MSSTEKQHHAVTLACKAPGHTANMHADIPTRLQRPGKNI